MTLSVDAYHEEAASCALAVHSEPMVRRGFLAYPIHTVPVAFIPRPASALRQPTP